ncbi:MAG: cytochrome P450 [Dehalococcoidia bacterium]
MAKVTFDPSAPAWMTDPYSAYRALRETEPVHWSDGLGHWVLTRYEDVVFALRDQRFTATNRPPQRRWDRPTTMVTADPPDHGRLRKPVGHRFSLASVKALRPRIAQIVDGLLDAAGADGGMDVVTQFARPLPRTMISELMGVSFADGAAGMGAGASMADLHPAPEGQPQGSSSRLATGLAMPTESSFRDAIAAHREELSDDLLQELIKAETGGGMTAEEVLDTAVILYGAGQETTAKMIGNAVYHLLRHPIQLDKLRRDPALVEPATEELLRFDAPVHAISRRAREDVEIGGTTISASDKVLCFLAAADHDPAVFDRPEELDIERRDNPHVAFGAGIHACLGAALARAEIQIALAALVTRYPRLRLASDAVEWEGSFIIRGVRSLPVLLS